MRVDYPTLAATVAALTEGESDAVALMATLACEIHHADDRFDWTGFYRVTAAGPPEDRPLPGRPRLPRHPASTAVSAARPPGRARSSSSPTSTPFPDHIACAASTRSEIVLPVRNGAGDLIAVLDIDSDQPAAFDETDARALDAILRATFGRI